MKQSGPHEEISVKIFYFSYGKNESDSGNLGVSNLNNMFTDDEKFCRDIAIKDELPPCPGEADLGQILGVSFFGRVEYNASYYYQFAMYSSNRYKGESRNYILSDYIFVREEDYILLAHDSFKIIDKCFLNNENRIPEEIIVPTKSRAYEELSDDLKNLSLDFIKKVYAALFANKPIIFFDKSKTSFQDLALIISDFIFLLFPSRLYPLISFSTFYKSTNMISFLFTERYVENCVVFDFLKQEKIGTDATDFHLLPQVYTTFDNTKDLFEKNLNMNKFISKDNSIENLNNVIDFADSLMNTKVEIDKKILEIENSKILVALCGELCSLIDEKNNHSSLFRLSRKLCNGYNEMLDCLNRLIHRWENSLFCDNLASFIINNFPQGNYFVRNTDSVFSIFKFLLQSNRFEKIQDKIDLKFKMFYSQLLTKIESINSEELNDIPKRYLEEIIIELFKKPYSIDILDTYLNLLNKFVTNDKRDECIEYLIQQVLIIKDCSFEQFEKYFHLSSRFEHLEIIISKINNHTNSYLKFTKDLFAYIVNGKNQCIDMPISNIEIKQFFSILHLFYNTVQSTEAKKRLLNRVIAFYNSKQINDKQLLTDIILKIIKDTYNVKTAINKIEKEQFKIDVHLNKLLINIIASISEQILFLLSILKLKYKDSIKLIGDSYNFISTGIKVELTRIKIESNYPEFFDIDDNLFIQFVLMDCYSQKPTIKVDHFVGLIERIGRFKNNEEKSLAMFVLMYRMSKLIDVSEIKRNLLQFPWDVKETQWINFAGKIFYNYPHILNASRDPQLEFLKDVLTFFENPEKKIKLDESSNKEEITRKLESISEKLQQGIMKKNTLKNKIDDFIKNISATRLIHLKK